jgi:hypothetical protein
VETENNGNCLFASLKLIREKGNIDFWEGTEMVVLNEMEVLDFCNNDIVKTQKAISPGISSTTE